MNKKLLEGVKIDMVTADQMSSVDRDAIFNVQASTDAIPDLDTLSGLVFEILEYLEDPDTRKLMKVNDTAVKMYLNNKYADTVPLGIITLLVDEKTRDENVDRLLRMFESLKRAKQGFISLDEAEKNITDEVNERYLYSKHGGKEEFEKALAVEVRKEQKEKMKNNIGDIKRIKPTIKN